MNAVAVRTAGRYLGAWGAIVLCVILLSLLFTFLGTITCAVLAGMMMGAFKGAKWFSVLVSLVFPVVILGMARGAKVELAPQQITMLAALCFGTFWVTYLVSAFLFFCEQKGKKPCKRPGASAQNESLPQGELLTTTGCAPAAETRGFTVPDRESYLEQLQGNWVSEASSPGEPLYKRVIQIKEARLELKAVDTTGRITLLAAGDLSLQSFSPSQALVIPQAASEPADFMVGL
jgi:hypothetical protein